MPKYMLAPLILIWMLICINCTGERKQAAQPNAIGRTEPTRMIGMYQYMADAGLFRDCASDARVPVAMEADNASLERAYLAARSQPGEEMLVSLNGRIEQRPAAEGDSEVDTLIVTKFEHIWPAESCAKSTVETPLANTHWKLVELMGKPVETPSDQKQEVYLRFQEEGGRVSGFAGCNNLNGGYQTDAGNLTFGLLATTMMACPQLDREQEFLKALESVKRFTILGESLVLSTDRADAARFSAVYSK